MNRGRIELILGPMFSGKTSELGRRIRRHKIAKRKCVIIKYDKDIRYGKDIFTHDGVSMTAIATSRLNNLYLNFTDYAVIGIDEGQFFPDIVEFCEEMAKIGKIVIIAALDATFQRIPFGNILNIIPIAEEVIKLSSICTICGESASFSKRITNETEVEVIGGIDKYIATCRKCYFL
ncbi:Thymidine kinase [Eptesipox virus]|uniref:Thymidine kinase n=1 Tax=Eptesipox virus TaxID=1329402 RepID=A0A220T6C7_9POXV|nr:thymidine kinase [Eptesipox virus]ASK51271.1 Thymidine kinase [Eptesipox virus]WAH71029.1 thymidine kinase [Eptesipox virus]